MIHEAWLVTGGMRHRDTLMHDTWLMACDTWHHGTWNMTDGMWLIWLVESWYMTHDWRWATCNFMECDPWKVTSVDTTFWLMTDDRWYHDTWNVTDDRSHVIIWHVNDERWQLTLWLCNTWLMTGDKWHLSWIGPERELKYLLKSIACLNDHGLLGNLKFGILI